MVRSAYLSGLFPKHLSVDFRLPSTICKGNFRNYSVGGCETFFNQLHDDIKNNSKYFMKS